MVAVVNDETTKIPTSLIGAAGVHFVVSELSLRGLVALPTTRNTAGIDVLVSEPDGSAQAALQVKTSLRPRKWGGDFYWPTSSPEKCLKGPRSFYVFVRHLPSEGRFEAFLESGDEVARQVAQNRGDYEHRGSSVFHYWVLPSDPIKAEKCRDQWHNWRPPADCGERYDTTP